MDWPHIGAVMHYSGYVEPQDGAVSFLLSHQQEAVTCVRCIQKKVTVLKGAEWRKSRMSQFEQQENVKFSQKLGKSSNETFHMIK
jgi:hypothetical protein